MAKCTSNEVRNCVSTEHTKKKKKLTQNFKFTLFRLSSHSIEPDDVKIQLIYFTIQICCAYTHLLLVTTPLSTFFGLNYYTTAFCKDFQLIFNRIDKNVINVNRNCLQINKIIFEIVKFKKTLIQ